MQRQAENAAKNIDLLNMSQEDSRILFHLLTQHQTINYFQAGKKYPISINGKSLEIILSHPVTKKIRQPKLGKNIQPGEYRHEIIGKQLGDGFSGFFCKSICTIKLDKTTQFASIKPKETRGVKFISFDTENPKQSKQLAAHEYNMLRLAADIFNPRQLLIDKTAQYALLPMKLFSGEDFFDYLFDRRPDSRFNRLDLRQRLILCNRILEAVQHLHQRNIVHRDLKPDNMLINPETLDISIIDLGLSRDRRTTKKIEKGLGTPAYASPETFLSKPILEPGDVFALGRIFTYILGYQETAIPFYHLDEKCPTAVYAEMAKSGRFPQYTNLFNRVPYATNTDTKILIYNFLLQTQAVNPSERPTISQCREHLDAILKSHVNVLAAQQAATISATSAAAANSPTTLSSNTP